MFSAIYRKIRKIQRQLMGSFYRFLSVPPLCFNLFIECPFFIRTEVHDNRPGYKLKKNESWKKLFKTSHIVNLFILSQIEDERKMMMVNWCELRDLHYFIFSFVDWYFQISFWRIPKSVIQPICTKIFIATDNYHHT